MVESSLVANLELGELTLSNSLIMSNYITDDEASLNSK